MTIKNKKQNIARIRREAAREVQRQDRLDRLRRAAASGAGEVLDELEATRRGLDTADVPARRARWDAGEEP